MFIKKMAELYRRRKNIQNNLLKHKENQLNKINKE